MTPLPTTGISTSPETRELFARIARVLELPRLEVAAIGRALDTAFEPAANDNPYFRFFGAVLDGAAASARFKEPGEGATSHDRILTIELRPDAGVGESDVTSRFGAGDIAQIMPRANPAGLISVSYQASPRFALHCQLRADTRELRAVTISEAK